MRLKHNLFGLMLVSTVALILQGCASLQSPERISGKYVNKDTLGYIEFRKDGNFYYSFLNPAPPLGSDGHPQNMGTYYFRSAEDLTPYISVRSAHAGRFALRFSPLKDRVYLKHEALSPSELEYERVQN